MLFTHDAHHSEITVIITTQTYFGRGKNNRLINQNTEYIFLLASPGDSLHLELLSRRIFARGKGSFAPYLVKQAWDWVKEHVDQGSVPRYIMLDFRQDRNMYLPDFYRVKTNIFPDSRFNGNVCPIYFVPKSLEKERMQKEEKKITRMK